MEKIKRIYLILALFKGFNLHFGSLGCPCHSIQYHINEQNISHKRNECPCISMLMVVEFLSVACYNQKLS